LGCEHERAVDGIVLFNKLLFTYTIASGVETGVTLSLSLQVSLYHYVLD